MFGNVIVFEIFDLDNIKIKTLFYNWDINEITEKI